MTIFPPHSAEQALPRLFMPPIIPPDDHSPVKRAPSVEFVHNCDESDSSIDDIEGTNINTCKVFQDINLESVIDDSY